MMKTILNKKVDAQAAQIDILAAIIFLLISSIGIAIAFLLSNGFSAANPSLFGSAFGFQYLNEALSILADGIVIIFMASMIISLLGAYLYQTAPYLVIVSFFILGLNVLISQVGAAVFSNIISTSFFINIGQNDIPQIVALWQVIAIAVLILGIIAMIANHSRVGG